jgi:hypothetical protein
MLRARERAPTPWFSVVFSLGLTFESLKELGVRHNNVYGIETSETPQHCLLKCPLAKRT